MRRNSSQFAVAAVSLLCILILAACNCGPTLQSITITPASATIDVGTTQQFTATGHYSNGTTKPGITVTWGSSNKSIATITSAGIATPLAPGTTTITAAAARTPGATATLNVNQLTSIALTPANETISAGAQQQYDAVGTFTLFGGTTGNSDVTSLVDSVSGWSSSNTSVATIGAGTGLATGVAQGGPVTISASLYGVKGSTNLTVGAAVPQSLVITPSASTAAIGNAVSFTAQEMYSDGTLHAPAGTVSWTSGTTTTATIVAIAPSSTAANAIAAALAAGSTTITATEGTLTPGTAALTVVTGTAHYAYVSNINANINGGENIQWYSVTATKSPYLTSNGTVTVSGIDPVQTFLHPSGKFMYVIDVLSDVYVYDIAPSSSTTPPPGTPIFTNQTAQVAGDASSDYGVVDPYGRFLYVVNNTDSTVYGYQISQTDGSLTAIKGSPFSANVSGPLYILIDRSGTYAYVVNNGNDTVSAYTITQTPGATWGALTPFSTNPTIATGSSPYFAALDPSGTHIYVPNNVDNTVSGYTIGSGGVLSLLSTTTITGAASVLNVAVDPSGKYLYVLDAGVVPGNGQLYGYTLTGGVPSTTAITSTPIATGEAPTGIAIDPTTSLIAVDNGGDGVDPSTISLFSIGTGGALTTDTPVAAGVSPIFVIFYNAP
jgi:DNA-binding beta-propeller fold protein YncE